MVPLLSLVTINLRMVAVVITVDSSVATGFFLEMLGVKQHQEDKGLTGEKAHGKQ